MTKKVTVEMAEKSLKQLMWYANMAKSNEPEEQRCTRIVEAGFVLHEYLQSTKK